MATQQAFTSMWFHCLGEGSVCVAASAVERSKLLQGLPSVPQQLRVPFSQYQVEAWDGFNARGLNRDLLALLDVLQVADFLQDEAGVAEAVKAAQRLFTAPMRCPGHPSVTQAVPAESTEQLSERETDGLLSLKPHLAHVLLHNSNGLCYTWFKVLPASCHHLIIAASVQDGKLMIPKCLPHTAVDRSAFLQALQTVGSLVEALVLNKKCCAEGFAENAEAARDALQPLVQLRDLELRDFGNVSIPASLTLLTSLRIHYTVLDQGRLFTCDEPGLPALKELELHGKMPHPIREWGYPTCPCLPLPTMHSLTKLVLTEVLESTCESVIGACVNLRSLAYHRLVTSESMPQNVASTCTELHLRRTVTPKRQQDFEELLFRMPQLRKLRCGINDISSMPAVGTLHNLQHVDVEICSEMIDTVALLDQLPVSLTTLCIRRHRAAVCVNLEQLCRFKDLAGVDLQCLALRLPDGGFQGLKGLTNLKSVELSRCDSSALQLLQILPVSLTQLEMGWNELSEPAVPLLCAFTELQSLSVGDGRSWNLSILQSAAQGVAALSQLMSLRLVGLSGQVDDSDITRELYEALLSLPCLSEVSTSHLHSVFRRVKV